MHPDDYDKYKAMKKAKKVVAKDVQKEEAMAESFKKMNKNELKTAINTESEVADAEEDNDEMIRNVQGKQLVKDPKYESWVLLMLFLFFKLFRTYYVIWGYYFTPIYALFLNFYYNFKWK